LAASIQDTQAEASCAFNLGRAYEGLGDVRDLALAEHWYQRSLELRTKEDSVGRAGYVGQLGSVAHRRFFDAEKAGRSHAECVGYLSKAERYYKQALEMFPAGAIRGLATTHQLLGVVYSRAGRIDEALRQYHESIRHREAMQDCFGAGQTRYNAAIALSRAGRLADARDWAQAALRDFEACENADQEVIATLKLLEQIESDLQATPPPS
jgi:tetratricopeptide (TPR) repeat protein